MALVFYCASYIFQPQLTFALFVRTISAMDIVFDAKKDMANLAKHGISLNMANDFDWSGAYYEIDNRKDYGEKRILAFGNIKSRLHIMVFTRSWWCIPHYITQKSK